MKRQRETVYCYSDEEGLIPVSNALNVGTDRG